VAAMLAAKWRRLQAAVFSLLSSASLHFFFFSSSVFLFFFSFGL
jgi:hypothetical protein